VAVVNLFSLSYFRTDSGFPLAVELRKPPMTVSVIKSPVKIIFRNKKQLLKIAKNYFILGEALAYFTCPSSS
jgi:hypothetical protein